MKAQPRWLTKRDILDLHGKILGRDGGAAGLLDEGGLESALARAPNAYTYGEEDLLVLAAHYAFGLARNHCFRDGNKRIAATACGWFLRRHDIKIRPRHKDMIRVFEELSQGTVTVEQLAAWLGALAYRVEIEGLGPIDLDR